MGIFARVVGTCSGMGLGTLMMGAVRAMSVGSFLGSLAFGVSFPSGCLDCTLDCSCSCCFRHNCCIGHFEHDFDENSVGSHADFDYDNSWDLLDTEDFDSTCFDHSHTDNSYSPCA